MSCFLLFLGLCLSNTAFAQNQVSAQVVLPQYYWGISSGLQTPVRYVPAPHELYNRYTFNAAPITELLFGRKLSELFYLEAGLLHTYDIKDPYGGMAVCYIYPYYGEHHLSTHTFSIPIGLRYRSNGKKFRPTAGLHLVPIKLLAIDRYEEKLYYFDQTITDTRTQTWHTPALSESMRISLGMEYQMSKKWFMRLEAQTIGEYIFTGPRRPMLIRPSLSLGIFRSFG